MSNKRINEILELSSNIFLNYIKNDKIESLYEDLNFYSSHYCQSPIERLFMIGLLTYLEAKSLSCLCSYLVINGLNNDIQQRIEEFLKYEIKDKTYGYKFLITQYRIGKYTVDFLIQDFIYLSKFDMYKEYKIIIECDGHDFHEKTKEQAKKDKERDRYLQMQGYHVLRFTGSEIYNQPFECSELVFDYLDELHQKDYRFALELEKVHKAENEEYDKNFSLLLGQYIDSKIQNQLDKLNLEDKYIWEKVLKEVRLSSDSLALRLLQGCFIGIDYSNKQINIEFNNKLKINELNEYKYLNKIISNAMNDNFELNLIYKK